MIAAAGILFVAAIGGSAVAALALAVSAMRAARSAVAMVRDAESEAERRRVNACLAAYNAKAIWDAAIPSWIAGKRPR